MRRVPATEAVPGRFAGARRCGWVSPQTIERAPLASNGENPLVDALWQGIAALDRNRAVLLLGGEGHVLRASSRALQVIEGAAGLGISDTVLTCRQASDQCLLESAIASAIRADAPQMAAFWIGRGVCASSLRVAVHPLAEAHPSIAFLKASAVVAVLDRF